MRIFLFACFLSLTGTILDAQDFVVSLYPEGIPCSNELTETAFDVKSTGRRIQKIQNPELAVYLARGSTSNGSSVVICPGGGYATLAWDWEGTRMAEWYNSFGVSAFVLKYRLPRWESESCSDKVALMDAQRAMRIVRMNAKEWNINPNQVGVMGFSAGGHLASTLSTHFDRGDANANLEVDRFSCRPDYSILMYPVISMDSTFGHMGSKRNLIGDHPTMEQEANFSNELQVTTETPPTILIHASDDKSVLPENSIRYYQALLRNKVSASLHIYEVGGHGFSFATGKGSVEQWASTCKIWMQHQGLLQKKIKTLIVEGQNNHKNWMETTVIMKDYLESSGLFDVVVERTDDIKNFKPTFSDFDLVVSNYNGESWPEETKAAFEKFMASGGGFVCVHAADNAFGDWQAYNEMIGLGGWGDRTEASGPYVYYDRDGELVRDETPGKGGHHGEQHAFEIQIRDSEHPITNGLPKKWMHAKDELYDQLRGPAVNMKVLATAYSDPKTGGTDRNEPVLMTTFYGLGRAFHTTLGHLNESQEHIGFKTTFLRGAEWVATGKVTQEVPAEFMGSH